MRKSLLRGGGKRERERGGAEGGQREYQVKRKRRAKDNTSGRNTERGKQSTEIDFPRSILARAIDSNASRFSFPLSQRVRAFTDYGFVEFGFFRGPGKWGD